MDQTMTETPERPLVTFALFAYNQEKYIREAVEGAFSQTYEPMEIILSDDCSSDRTFDIMQEMAAEYKGPHQVAARQTVENRGVLGHVLEVANRSSGKYFVVAAGDDVSLPERTKTLVSLLKTTDAVAISSSDTIIDAKGTISDKTLKGDFKKKGRTWGIEVSRIHGATAAYRLDFLLDIPAPESSIFMEDSVFEVFAHFKKMKVACLNTPLVHYRHHDANISVRHNCGLEQLEKMNNVKMQRYAEAAAFSHQSLRNRNIESDELKTIESYAAFMAAACHWMKLSFRGKIRILALTPDISMLKWYLPRMLLPSSIFIQLKEQRNKKGF